MEINITKSYKTRNGLRVRIYATDSNSDRPVHGAYYNEDGSWTCGEWTITGRCRVNGKDSSLDIVSEWKERPTIDSNEIPTFKWVAKDANGNIFLYTKKPVISDSSWIFEGENHEIAIQTNSDVVQDLNMHWKKSLHEIVYGELVEA